MSLVQLVVEMEGEEEERSAKRLACVPKSVHFHNN